MTTTRTSRVSVHLFESDPDLSREYVTSDRRGIGARQWCSWCGLPGEPGDERHPYGAAPRYPETPAEVRSVELRRLGEHNEGE